MLLDQLLQHYKSRGDAGLRQYAQGLGLALREGKGMILVPVIADRGLERSEQFQQKLARAGARVDDVSRSWMRILVPAARLDLLLGEFPNESLHAPGLAIPAFGTGSVVSESVALTAADGYQAGNLAGAGVRVAVVDLGFIGLSTQIANGELPASTVAVDFTNNGGAEAGTKHGTAVAEEVMDMAPGAQLYCLRVGDYLSLQKAADYLAANNIRIANHSVSWFLFGYYDDTGYINSTIDQSHDNDGVFWSVAAGNMAQRHWRGNWADADLDGFLDFDGDNALGLVGSSGTVTVAMNWDQYTSHNRTDLALYVYDVNNHIAATSNYDQTTNSPAEIVSFPYVAGNAPYRIKVGYISGSTSNLDITIFSINHNLDTPVTSSSLLDPADAHGAFAVGAINQANWRNTSPPVDSYSSQGPTNTGSLKPELVAPDHTSTVTYGTQASSGTSFAAPVTAGAAALLLSEDGTRTAVQLASLLESGAVDVGSTGADNIYGYGKLQLPLIDSDQDGLTNVEEIQLGTNPLDPDTDHDGLSDSAEVHTYGTNPLLADTDGDGVSDYVEIMTFGTNPLVSNMADLAPRGSTDGVIDAADLAVLSRLVTGQSTASAAEQAFGDLNRNGTLDAGDLVLMNRVVQGIIPVP